MLSQPKNFFHPVKIGPLEFSANIFMAPMSGCTDLANRLIGRQLGAQLCFFEMIDANALLYNSVARSDILKTCKEDQPIAAQLLGPSPEKVVGAAEILLKRIKPLFLDLNAACPVKKVVQKKAGAYLLQEPKILAAIVEKMAQEIALPITVKLRLGYEAVDQEKLIEIAKRCEQAGAAALFVHGRTKDQGYAGEIDYAGIKLVKDSVEIPVFGSGNIFSAQLAGKMFQATGCDGVLVARGGLGNPWLFKQIEIYLSGEDYILEVPLAEKIKVLNQHLQLIEELKEKSPRTRLGIMRKFALWYLKGFPDAAAVRGRLSQLASYNDLIAYIASLC